MIAYVKGILESKANDYVIIDVSGIGYKVFMSEFSMERLGNIGDTVKVHTYYRVREDDISLFGFNTAEELRMFELLLSVSGVGAKTALTMLACVTPSEFAIAVIQNDVSKLVKIPGIGAKSAQRIVLELKDKLKKDENISKNEDIKVKEVIKDDTKILDAITALQVLGYNRKEIEKAIEKLDTQEMSVEELIKKGLAMLSK
jgi:Holliday junction DNA helicase RuvA